jgi:serine/threonine protein kinase
MGYRRDTESGVVGVRSTIAEQLGQNRDQRRKAGSDAQVLGILLADHPLIMASGKEPDPTQLPETTGSQSARKADSAAAVGSGEFEDGVLRESIGSGLIKQAPKPTTDEHISVLKVCPQCSTEYETGDRFCPKDGAPLRPKVSGDPMIGRVIADRYLILARLGEGGMGRVYVAEHVKMNRQCAIKVMSATLMNDAESTTRFAREASNAARILHPNVAAVFDYGEADKTVYLVMEYIDGESLSTLLAREGALDPRRAIDIARQIADGLTAAHELGIVHRDLKPDNVIVATKRDGREIAKVVDFGIAKAVSDSPQDSLTRSGLVIGTPEYMSPEQLLGDPVDARADIYALGCMLYQMLTGVQPFDAETREQMIRRRLNEPPPHVQQTIPELPRRLDTLIAHMLARSPNERLASAASVSAGLEPALALAGWVASGTPRPMPSARAPRHAPTVVRPSLDPDGTQATIQIPIVKTNYRRIVLATSAGAVALVGGLFAWSMRSDDPAVAAAAAPAAVAAAPAGDSAKKVADDSAALATRALAARVDSALNKVPKKPAVPTDEAAIQETLNHFAMTVGNGEVAVVKEFPGIPAALLDGLRAIYLNERVRATAVQTGKVVVAGNRAEVPIVLRLSYQDRNSKQPGTFPYRQKAVLTKRGGRWILTELLPQ